jgi:hypothetical protein
LFYNLIKALEKELITAFREELEACWLIENADEIKARTAADLLLAEIKWAERYQCDPESHPKNKSFHGYIVAADISCDIKKSTIEEKIIGEYTQLFINNYWHPELANLISQQIDHYESENILKQLFERHPWIKEEVLWFNEHSIHNPRLDASDLLAYQFLKPLLQDALHNLPSHSSESSWSWSTVTHLLTNQKWEVLKPEHIENEIKGFPLSDIHSLYSHNRRYLPSQETSFYKAEQAIHSPLSRLDLYRFLDRNYPEQCKPIRSEGIFSTMIAPFHGDELAQLSPEELKPLRIMLVNLVSEASPLWICLHKQGTNEDSNDWTAYVPPDMAPLLLQAKIAGFTAKGASVSIYTVDYKNNASLNDISGLSDDVLWHSVLLGRIIPFCGKKLPDLQTYRHNIPVSVFFEYMLTSCLLSNSKVNALNMAFSKRKPLSTLSVQQHVLQQNEIPNYVLKDEGFFNDTARVPSIFKAFDDKTWELISTTSARLPDTLRLSATAEAHHLKLAQFIIYHNSSLSTLEMSSMPIPAEHASATSVQSLKILLSLNTNSLTVKPLHVNHLKQPDSLLSLAMRAAARNRFLITTLNVQNWAQTHEVPYRKQLWQTTGQKLFDFYKNDVDLDFINSYLIWNKKWQASYYDHQQKPKDVTLKSTWLLAQVAQMGMQGLDALFDHINTGYVSSWNSIYKETAPNLTCTFDLNGSLNDEPLAYLEHLKRKIESFGRNTQGCTPLFKSLSLIIPAALSSISNELVRLFQIIHTQKIRFSDGLGEISLFNLNIKDETDCNRFLSNIEKLALDKSSPLQILIHIPEWDRESFTKKAQWDIKAKYKQIQNLILENQRHAKLALLTRNTQNMYLCDQENLDPEIIINNGREKALQNWDGEDTFYPLTAHNILGIQQQLQQAVEQEYEQEIEQEQEEEQELEQEISEYKGDEGALITRLNIDEQYFDYWNELPEETKQYSGWQQKNLSQLFSLWVGSDTNATHVIKKLEPDAVKKIMDNTYAFRMALSRDNLPPGFSLAYSRKDRGLILCFNHRREKEALLERAEQLNNAKKPNPFTVVLHQPMAANDFRGDFRQFNSISSDVQTQKLLWKYLATEDKDIQRIENAIHFLLPHDSSITRENASTQMQQQTVFQQVGVPAESIEECRIILKNWAAQLLPDSLDVVNALFDKTSPLVLTEKNLRALGQLFYRHQVEQTPLLTQNASYHFLFLAQKIYDAFGSSHFAIWQQRILVPSLNLSECLTKEEVDAVALSIVTLKNKSDVLQNIWWALIDAHGQSTGHMHYAPLWYSYQKLIKYLEKNHLLLNEKSMLVYLKNATDFHAQVFMDRLYYVLRHCEKQLQRQDTQQNLLDHIAHIDWRHNGLYYATRYEHHSYWDDALQLSSFNEAINPRSPSYIPALDYDSGSDLIQILRYASLRMQMKYADFNRFKTLIQESFVTTKLIDKVNGRLILRLLVACTSQGIDRFSDLTNEDITLQIQILMMLDSSLLRWLNETITLDQELKPGSIQLKFEHISLFINSVTQAKLELQSSWEAVEFINSSGRALQCYSSPYITQLRINDTSAENNLIRLFQYLSTYSLSFSHPLLKTYPWLLFNLQHHSEDINTLRDYSYRVTYSSDLESPIKLFEKQMQSINFNKSTSLPSLTELDEFLRQLSTYYYHYNEYRTDFINDHIRKGCAITFQDAAYRPLNEQERDLTVLFMEKHLKINFKAQNLLLAQKFFTECIAVTVDGTAQKTHLETLLFLLSRIDNKPYYNDLGQVLGLLIEQSKTNKGQQKYYSLEQLISWLDSLVDPQQIELQHYPTTILREILINHDRDETSHYPSSLLNSNLNRLSASIEPRALQQDMQAIVRSDLPSQYKHILAKLALVVVNNQIVKLAKNSIQKIHKKNADPQWLKGLGSIIGLIGTNNLFYQNVSRLLARCSMTTDEAMLSGESPSLLKLWEKSQIKLMSLFQHHEKRFTGSDLDLFEIKTLPKDAYISMIILQMIKPSDISKNKENLLDLKTLLPSLSIGELKVLAHYCSSPPIPSITTFIKLLKQPALNYSVTVLIHHFETIEQATKSDGTSKRHYSITETDNRGLLRVLNGLKRKSHGAIIDQEQKKLLNLLYYLNNYSQATHLASISFDDLKNRINGCRQLLNGSLHSNNTEAEKEFASAQLLACMREVLLRKTGKWVNHTQMLDLIYAALHSDNGLLHQVKMGQGKSIISIMRASYLALNGYVVDVFSSKESLSKRDHAEFSYVLDALDIRNSYITPHSPSDDYQSNDSREHIGAVNYATIGNFSLFQSTQAWQQLKKINLDPKIRVAFVDEADHILQDEDTQFNYSDNDQTESVYNFDEWVYRLTYDFYLERKKEFKVDERGIIKLSRNTDLKALCSYLQQESETSPKHSDFLKKYIIPALGGEPEAIQKRDNQLKQLLVAAHAAHGLQEGLHFCIRPDQQTVSNGTVINTRFAKVMINNQIKHGSTYSELVHQLLHIRLNKEAVAKGQAPNFFVEPNSQVALSSNAKYLLQKYYYKIEGCTGTAGNTDDLKRYERIYAIKNIIKLPSHEESATDYLGIKFCDNYQAQIDEIINTLLGFSDRPILLACRDDIEVKKIFASIKQTLEQKKIKRDLSTFIVDTNDSGLAESEIVPLAGAVGKIIISSRLGRGTDIQPETDRGLMVLRTYPTTPRVRKQELGRQGRNGAKGTCIDIIDYSDVKKQYETYLRSPRKDRIAVIMAKQLEHLENKLEKHDRIRSTKWDWLHTEEDKSNYLKTRAVEELNHELKKRNEVYLRQKEYLIATLSGNIIEVLQKNHDNKSFSHADFHQKWLDLRGQIETLWNIRLAGQLGDNEEIYAHFFQQAAGLWSNFCSHSNELKRDLFSQAAEIQLDGADDNLIALSPAMSALSSPINKTEFITLISFYQAWVQGAEKAYFTEPRAKQAVLNAIYGVGYQGLNFLFQTLYSMSCYQNPLLTTKIQEKKRSSLFTTLNNLNKPQIHLIPTKLFAQVISELLSKSAHDDYNNYLQCLEHFFKLEQFKNLDPKKMKPADLIKMGLLFKSVMYIAMTHYSSKEDATTFELMQNLCKTIRDDFWDDLDEPLAADIYKGFAYNAESTAVFTNQVLTADFHYFISLLNNNKTSAQREKRLEELGTYLKPHWQLPSNTLGFIRPLLQIIFNDAPNTNQNYLPEPYCLKNLSPEIQGTFWSFLAARCPINKEEVTSLIKILTDGQNTSSFYDAILKPLVDLPPYISLHYINQKMKGRISHTNCNDGTVQLAEIKTAAIAFNTFTLKFGLIKSNQTASFPTPQVKDEYDFFVQQFNQMQPKQNELFFNQLSQAAYTVLPLKTVTALCGAWREKRINGLAQLTDIADLCVEAHHFPDKQCSAHMLQFCAKELKESTVEPLKASLYHIEEFIYQTKAAKLFKRPLELLWHEWQSRALNSNQLQEHIQLIKKAQKDRLSEDHIATIYSQKADNNIDKITRIFNIIKKIRDFEHRYNSISLMNKFVTMQDKSDLPIARYEDFLAEINTKDLPEKTVSLLWKHWNNKTIKGKEQLQHHCQVLQEALALEKNSNWSDYFGHFDNKKQANRLFLMKLLHQGIFTLGKTFTERCYKEYQQLISRFIQIPNLAQTKNTVERCRLITNNYRNVVRVAEELHEISQDDASKKPVGDANFIHQDQHRFFQEQQKVYNNTWWKNSIREHQANHLFRSLLNLDSYDSENSFHKQSLECIWASQKAILRSDVNTKRNTKGYSRLYDITVQMTIQIARQFMSNPKMTGDDAAWIHQFLEQQMDYQIKLLAERLPDTHVNKKWLSNYSRTAMPKDSTEYALFQEQLRSINKEGIPRHLHYLVTNVACFMDLSEKESNSLDNERGLHRY